MVDGSKKVLSGRFKSKSRPKDKHSVGPSSRNVFILGASSQMFADDSERDAFEDRLARYSAVQLG